MCNYIILSWMFKMDTRKNISVLVVVFKIMVVVLKLEKKPLIGM